MNISKYLAAASFILLIVSCQSSEKPYQTTRGPSSEGELPIKFSQAQISMMKDMFLADQVPGTQKLKVTTEFRSDYKNKDFIKRAKNAIKRSMMKTFQAENPSRDEDNDKNKDDFSSRLKENLIKALMSEFVFNLKFYKLINGNISFSVFLLPEPVDSDNLFNEYNNNNFVDLNHFSDFSDIGKEAGGIINALNLKYSEPGEYVDGYKYLGGAIFLNVNFVDLGVLKKEILNGEIVYRKYYRASDERYPVNYVALKTKLKDAAFTGVKTVTVDITKEFNLAETTPKLKDMQIHFGGLMYHGKRDYSSKLQIYDSNNRAVIDINALNYNFESKVFDLARSRTRETVKSTGGGRGSGKPIRRNRTPKLSDLLKNNKDKFIEALHLKRFWNEI